MRPMMAFLPGRSGGIVSIQNETLDDTQTYPAAASAFYTLANDGAVEKILFGATTNIGTWLVGSGAYSSYESRATLVSGSTPSGTLNTWQALSSDRSWGVSRSSYGTTTCVLTIEIRDAAGTVRDAATITLSATVES